MLISLFCIYLHVFVDKSSAIRIWIAANSSFDNVCARFTILKNLFFRIKTEAHKTIFKGITSWRLITVMIIVHQTEPKSTTNNLQQGSMILIWTDSIACTRRSPWAVAFKQILAFSTPPLWTRLSLVWRNIFRLKDINCAPVLASSIRMAKFHFASCKSAYH